MTFSALGISIETRGADESARRLDAVSAAANKVDDAVSKIAPAANDASAGLRKIGQDAQTAENALSNFASRTLTGFSAIAHRAAQEAEYIAAQMERMTFHDVRGNDIAAYGAELDRLRAKYNPLFAASKRYEMELDELNRAEKIGAISAREHGAALNELNARYQATSTAVNGYTVSAGMARAQTQNMMYQFQDIGMMMALGQNPFVLLAQQLPQIVQHGGRLNGVMGALKQTVSGLFSPLGLATTAFVLAGSAAISYFNRADDDANSTNKALEDQENLIRRVADRWGDALPAIKAYADELDRVKSLDEAKSATENVVRDLYGPLQEAARELRIETADFVSVLSRAGVESTIVDSLNAAFIELQEKIANNTATLADADTAQKLLNSAMALGIGDASALSYAFDLLVKSLKDVAEQAGSANASLSDLENRGGIPRSNLGGGRGSDPRDIEKDKYWRDRYFPAPEKENREAARAMREAEREADKLARAYDRLFSSAQRQVDMLEQEVGLVGKSGVEAEALRFKYDLLAKAKEDGIALGADELRRIDELTEAHRALAEQLAAMEAFADISFDLSIMGMSEGDQRIMSSLRQLGIDANSAYGQMVGGAMRYRDVQQELQDEMQKSGEIGKQAFMSILDILYETGDIGDKLIGIFANIGKQFAQMGMEKLWKQISGEGGSIFGGGSAPFTPGMAFPTAPSAVQSQQLGQSIGQSIAPAITTSLNGSLQSYAAAIRKIESGSYEGNYGAMGPVMSKGSYAGDRAYGAYQVMGKNIASWTKEATGTALSIQQFLADKGVQDRVFAHKFGQSIDKFGSFADGASVWFSGRPLSKAGNASDGFNTVPQYVQKAQSALDNYPGGIKAGVSDGVVDATRKIAQMPEMAGNGPMGHIPTPQQGGGMLGGANMQGLMAGIGAFAGGMQSGDPLGGALSGGLGMMGAGFGPMGIAAGAVLGLIGGLIGKAKQKKEELKKARQELEQQMGAITDLIARATGNFMGSYQSALMKTSDEFAKAIALAEKAKNTKLTKELNDAQDEFFDNMADTWRRNFDGMIASMESGMGLDSAYMAGMDAVEKMREGLVGFVNDAKMFSEAGDDLAGWVKDLKGVVKETGLLYGHMESLTKLPDYFSGGINVSQDMKDAVERWSAEIEALGLKVFNEGVAFNSNDPGAPITAVYDTVEGLRDKLRDFGVTFDEHGQIVRAAADANGEYADAVEQARQAAIKTALAAISGADEFTAMEEAVDKAEGAAKNMASLLDDLGVSAEDAARAIDSHLNIAMAKMRDAYRDELNASINDLSGFGFINEIVDAHKRYEDRLRDAAKLGLDTSLAMKELDLSLRGIVSSSSLTQAEIDMLAAAWPAMAGLIEAAAGKDAMAMVAEAESALRAAYEKQRGEIEATISRLERFTDTIKQFREEMRVNASSPLSQREQMEEALRLYRETAAAAMSGDEEAQNKLTSVSQSALDEARAYYASSEEYAKIWNEIDHTLELVERSAGRQLTEAQQQLEALKTQVGALIDINESVLTVADAIAALANATVTRDRAMQDQIDAAKGSGMESRTAQVSEMYRSILGRTGRADEIDWWANSGRSIAQIRADIEWQKQMGSFQSGGYTGNIGTSDIAGIVHGQEFVMNAEATRRVGVPELAAINAGRSPGNDNSVVVAALQREIGALTAEVRGLKVAVAATGTETANAVKEGNNTMSDVAMALKRAGSR